MLMNALRVARRERPTVRLMVSADTPKWICDEYEANRAPFLIHVWGRWESISKFFNLFGIGDRLAPIYHALATALVFLLTLLPDVVLKRLPGMEAACALMLKGASLIYFNGGGYLTDVGRTEMRALLLGAIIARSRGAKIVLTGQGIGPFDTRISKWLMQRVLVGAQVFVSREKESTEYWLNDLDASRIGWIPGVDDACSLGATYGSENLAMLPRIAIHCRVSHYHPMAEKASEILWAVFDKYLALGYKIELYVFQESDSMEAALYRRWVAERPGSQIEIVASEDPRYLINRISGAQLSIGMAYHFHLFSLLAGCAALALYSGDYYRAKFAGLAQHFSCPESFVDLELASVTDVLELIEGLAADKAVRADSGLVASIRQRCDRQIELALSVIH